jgi:RNA-binding protein
MKLSKSQLKHLKAMSHKLKPVVIVGNAGLTDSVLDEIDSSIEHHELIKVRLNAADRDERQIMIEKIGKSAHAVLINSIGHVAVFYRPASKPIIKLPS